MKKTIIAAAVVLSGALTARPQAEINLPELHLPTGTQQITVSWDFTGTSSPLYENPSIINTVQHFSIERYINNDINDAFVIYHNHKIDTRSNSAWHEIGTELFFDTDGFWADFEIGF